VIVLVEQQERTFFSDLGSSSLITLNHFRNSEDIFKNSKIFYADAYLIGKRYDLFEYVFKNFYNDSILLALSAASEYIVRDNAEKLIELLPYLDIFFINLEELRVLRKAMNMDNLNDDDFFYYLSVKTGKANKVKKRVFINTRGNNASLIYELDFNSNSGLAYTVPVVPLDKKYIIDTNGAGDSYSGGFLAGILMDYSIQDSAKFGNCVAAEVIQLKGFQIPEKFKCFKSSNEFNVEVQTEIIENLDNRKDEF
jgi:sugar/nucleoside kinase (ribokinase family)